MTTPQEMETEKETVEGNWLYRMLTRLIAWIMFVGMLTMAVGLITFIGLALYRGIIWLWPGGGSL